METIDMRNAKRHLSRLVERAAQGHPFIIAKAGKPMVKVVPLDAAETGQRRRLGFLAGKIKVAADFDTIGRDEIDRFFADGA
jgi:prevent-host-death family protein